MKKLILALGAFALLGTSAMAQSNDEKKAEALKVLKGQIFEQLSGMGLDNEKAEKFSDCYIKDLEKNLTIEELEKVSKLKEGEMPSEDLSKKLAKAGESCAAVLQ